MTFRSKILLVVGVLSVAGVVVVAITPTDNTLYPLPAYFEGIPSGYITAPTDRRTMVVVLTNVDSITTVYIPPLCQGACTVMFHRSDPDINSKAFILIGGGMINAEKADKIYLWKDHKETEVFVWVTPSSKSP